MMYTRTLTVEVAGCKSCPYEEYLSSMGCSGRHECYHEDAPSECRICLEGELDKLEYGEFPDWCPLPEKDGGMSTAKDYSRFVKHYQQIADKVEVLAEMEAQKRKCRAGGYVGSFDIDEDGSIEVSFHEAGCAGDFFTFLLFDHDLFKEEEDENSSNPK